MKYLSSIFLLTALTLSVACSGSKEQPGGNNEPGSGSSGSGSGNVPDKVCVTGDANPVYEFTALIAGYANLTSDMTGDVVLGAVVSTESTPDQSNGISASTNELDSNNKFTVSVKGLLPETKYYYRTFVFRNNIYTYGDIKSFTTLKLNAKVSVLTPTDVFSDSAVLSAEYEVNTKGEVEITDFAIYVGKDGSADGLKSAGVKYDCSSENNGSFATVANNLAAGEKYYYMATVEFSGFEVQSEVKSFDTPEGEISISPNEVSLTDESGSFTVKLNSSGAWTVSNNSTWLNVIPTTGIASSTSSHITILVNENQLLDRTTEVVFSTGNKQAVLKVSQKGWFGERAGEGSMENPINVSATRVLMETLGYNQVSPQMYVKGVVSYVEPASEASNLYSIKLIDQGYPKGEISVEGCYYFGQLTFPPSFHLSVGDKVIITGKIDSHGMVEYSSWLYAYNGIAAGGYSGRLKFVLDWETKKLTVTEASEDDKSIGPEAEHCLYFGNSTTERFHISDGILNLVTDFSSNWGFLIMQKIGSWDSGTVWGGNGEPVYLGQPYQLINTSGRRDCIIAYPVDM